MREKYLVDKIKEELESIDEIQLVIPRPLGENEKITKYPCAIFYPESAENSYHDVKSNLKTYRYKLHLIIGLSNDTADNIFLSALPALVDAVEDKIDNEWDMGTLDGKRVWKWLDNGTSGIDVKTNEAIRSFDINIKLLTNIN